MKKTILALAVFPLLLLITAIGFTGIAKEREQENHVKLMETLLPGGGDFIKVDYDGEDQTIRSVHKASVGYVIETATAGYADSITVFVALDNVGNVMGILVSDAHETPGLGQGILTNHEFLSQFLNKTGNFSIGKAEDANTDASSSATDNSSPTTGDTVYIDGISGATVSSKAVARCVNSAIAYITGTDVDSSATS